MPFRCTLHFGVDVESKRLFVMLVLAVRYRVDYSASLVLRLLAVLY